MLKRSKFFLPALAFTLFFVLFALPAGAVSTQGGISVSKTAVSPGDTVTLTVDIPQVEPADTASISISYDSDVFELTSDVSGWSSRIPGSFCNSGAGFIALSASNNSAVILTDSGIKLTAELLVKDTAAAGTSVIKLGRHSLSRMNDNGYDFTELWDPSAAEVSVTVSSETSYPKTGGGISLTESTVEQNGEFSVNIRIPAIPDAVDTVDIRTSFDSSVFDVVTVSTNAVGAEVYDDSGHFGLIGADTSRSIDVSRGLSLTARMRVKSSARPGTYMFSITDSIITYTVGSEQRDSLWSPASRTASIRITDAQGPYVTGGGISTSKSAASPGDSLTLNISVPEIAAAANGANVSVQFSPDAFEIVSWKSTSANAVVTDNNNNINIGIVTGQSIDLSGGLTVSVNLKVLTYADPAVYTFRLVNSSLSYTDASGASIELWRPSGTSAAVNVSRNAVSLPVKGGGISLSRSSASAGDTVTASVKIPSIPINAESVYLNVEYNSTALEVISWTPSVSGVYANMSDGNFGLSGYDTNIDLSRGLTLTAQLRVKSTAPAGSYAVRITGAELYGTGSDGYSDQELWIPTATSASVTVGQSSSVNFPVRGGGISVSRSEVNTGDTFIVYVTVPKIASYADTSSIVLGFSSDAFEAVSWNAGLSGAEPSAGNGYFSLLKTGSSRNINLSNGLTVSVTMRVRENASSGSYTMRLNTGSFSYDTGYGHQEMWTPSTTSAAIRVVRTSSQTTTTTTAEVTRRTTTTTPDPAGEVEYINDDDDDDDDDTTTAPDYDDEDEYPVDYSEDEDDNDDIYDGEDNGSNDRDIVFTLIASLSNLSDGNIRVETNHSFFSSDTDFILNNSQTAETAAANALTQLGLNGHRYYAFDASIRDNASGRTVSDLRGGYAEFYIPVPKNLLSAGGNIEVYHITDGVPVRVDSSVVSSGDSKSVYFRSDSFSPYMFVDMSANSSSSYIVTAPANTPSQSTPVSGNNWYNGNINPATGVAAAILIPGTLTGCILLARKHSRHRKRTRTYVDDDKKK